MGEIEIASHKEKSGMKWNFGWRWIFFGKLGRMDERRWKGASIANDIWKPSGRRWLEDERVM